MMGLTDFLFPRICVNCKKEGSYVCASCIGKLPRMKQVCPECERAAVDGITHVKCKKRLGLDGLISLWPYEGVLRRAILSLKFKFAREVIDDLDKYALLRLREFGLALPKEVVFIPIPMYWYKENYRGFNQVVEIGRSVAKLMGWEFNSNVLVRKAMRRAQSSLKGDKRVENVKGVFTVNISQLSQICSNSIILFDDVYTTGSTLKEACKTLKRNRVKEVWGLTITR